MGRPLEGRPLSWNEAEEAGPVIRKWATEQLLRLWHKQRGRSDPEPSWGDEIEFTLVDLDSRDSRATMLLDQERIMRQWESDPENEEQASFQWEWATYVIETSPAKPYSGDLTDLLRVERDMRYRRNLVNEFLQPHQHTLSLSTFPRVGAEDHEWTTPSNRDVCSAQPRYVLLSKNVHERPQGRMRTYFPVYRDINTPSPFRDDPHSRPGLPNHVCLDQLEAGIGSCSIQTTFQAANEPEARWLYDQFIPLGPVFLALTAATPIWKGYLVETDIRWQRFGDLFDDRRHTEMESLIPRCTWNRTYISQEKPAGLESSRPFLPMDKTIKSRLMDGGMDEPLAEHFASILSRDPLLPTEADLEHQNASSTRLFELMHGCVWPHVRFKPPMSDNGPGWLVEFRPMEVQPTDFENAAFSIFTYLLSRAITTLHVNFYLPMDKVGEAWEQSQRRNAAVDSRLWFRRSGWSSNSLHNLRQGKSMCKDEVHAASGEEVYSRMSLDEIVNGEDAPGGFPGLLGLVQQYLHYTNVPPAEQARLAPYLDLIEKRASGANPTPATWMRDFVRQHDDYQQDSYVSEKTCHDMMAEIVRLNETAQRAAC